MAYSFKRAAKAIAVTSTTTAVAFAANGFSPIIPIRAFGIYASIIVLVNYAMVVLIMPSVQIVYEDNYKDNEAYWGRAILTKNLDQDQNHVGLSNNFLETNNCVPKLK